MPDSIRITTYPLFLEVIIIKLVENALFFTRINEDTDPLIHVTVSRNDKDIMLLVEDNGVGIDERVRPRIFEMFFRASIDSYGSGLGLYIVKQVVEKLQGDIKVESNLGEGTIFTVIIPNLKSMFERKEALREEQV